jgi:hypothetical protein
MSDIVYSQRLLSARGLEDNSPLPVVTVHHLCSGLGLGYDPVEEAVRIKAETESAMIRDQTKVS